MAKQPILDVFWLERFAEQGVRPKINHSRREIIASSPVSIRHPQLFGRKGSQFFGFASHKCSPGIETALYIRASSRPMFCLISLNFSAEEENTHWEALPIIF